MDRCHQLNLSGPLKVYEDPSPAGSYGLIGGIGQDWLLARLTDLIESKLAADSLRPGSYSTPRSRRIPERRCHILFSISAIFHTQDLEYISFGAPHLSQRLVPDVPASITLTGGSNFLLHFLHNDMIFHVLPWSLDTFTAINGLLSGSKCPSSKLIFMLRSRPYSLRPV